MNHLKNFAILTGALGLLTACAGMELDSARNMTPHGSEFAKGLYDGYIQLSQSEQDEADFEDSDVFAMRAEAAAAGNPPGPEAMSARKIPDGAIHELTDARARLVDALDGGGREKAPADAANAQVMFDCWMQEQEENFQPDDIAKCRAGFLSAIAKVEAATKMPKKMAEAPKPKPAPKPMAKPEGPPKFIVFFDFDSAAITPTGARTIEAAAAEAKKMKAGRVAVLGHADRAGPTRYNLGLSQRRAAAVAKALTVDGVSQGMIGTGALGESVPLVPTDDGVRNPENRRVEITILAN